MSYPAFSAPRRSRRRVITTILLLIAVTVAVVAVAVRSRSERRDSMDYLAATKAVAESQLGIAGSLADMLIGLNELERPDILERLADLDAEFKGLRADLDEQVVTAAVAEANGFMVVALDAWGEGLGSLDDAVLEIIDGEEEADGDTLLARAFSSLELGDRAYAGFREVVADLDEELRAPTFPAVAYIDPGEDLAYDPAVIADRLRRTLRFVENLDVSIGATTDPQPLGANGGLPVVPNSEFFTVQVVVTNRGNVPADLITVSLVLAELGEGGSQERSEIVASLDPGQATTVAFDEIVLLPGGRYKLRVRADLADDDVPDNNVWELDFIRGEL